MKVKKNDDTLYIKLPAGAKKQLDEKAASEGRTMSDVIRKMVDDYIGGKAEKAIFITMYDKHPEQNYAVINCNHIRLWNGVLVAVDVKVVMMDDGFNLYTFKERFTDDKSQDIYECVSLDPKKVWVTNIGWKTI